MNKPQEHDAYFFTRSDLSDEVKLEILREKIEERALSNNRTPLDEVCDRLTAKYSAQIKKAS